MNTTAANIPREPPEGSLAAAEYVIGIQDKVARRAAQARLERDPSFAHDVAVWESRFAPLLAEVAPVPPPFALWPRIRKAIGIPGIEDAEPTSRSPWQSLRLWRWLSAGGFALAAASLAALYIALPRTPPVSGTAHPLVATMARDDGNAAFVASIDAAGNLIVLPIAVTVPADRVAELWLIPPGDVPHSLGLIDARNARSILVPRNLRGALAANSTVAVSLEPPGGAPAGKPTGPIIAKGQIVLL